MGLVFIRDAKAAGVETMVKEKQVQTPRNRRQSFPHRATGDSTRVGREAEAQGEKSTEPLLRFSQERMVEAA